MTLWWVSWEEWESGECYTTRCTRELVAADTAERAVKIVMDADEPNWIGDTHFDRPVATAFVMPCNEGIVRTANTGGDAHGEYPPPSGSVPLVKYDPTPLPDKPCKTAWLGVELESGAEVRVGLQTGGIGLVHDMRTTQPDTGERTRLVFCLTPEAAGALVALYVAHGIIDAPNASADLPAIASKVRRDVGGAA